MSDQKPKIIYPEMIEYAWAKDLDRVYKNSKVIKQDYSREWVTADKLPKSPINLVLTIIKEYLSYPEVVNAWKKGDYSEDDLKRHAHLAMWFDEYIAHKYGNVPNPTVAVRYFLKQILFDDYSIDDPGLVEEMLEFPTICPDDGKDYFQPLAGEVHESL